MPHQDSETFELWKGLIPAESYKSGSDEVGGVLFIPTRNNIVTKRREIDSIWRSTEDATIRSLLRRARCYLDLKEPYKAPMDIVNTLTIHLVKGGIENPFLQILLHNSAIYMEHAISELKIPRWPVETQVLSLYQAGILGSMLTSLKKGGHLDQELDDLIDEVHRFEDIFPLHDITGRNFGEMISYMGEGDGHLGRRDIFPRVLSEMFALPDRHDVVEEKILLELYKEIPRLKRASFEVKEMYNTSMDSEDIADAIAKEKVIKEDRLIQTIERLKGRLVFWGVRRVIDYPHERDTGLIETPEYLRSVIGSGRYMNMNGLTGKPVNDLYITTDRGSKRPWSFPEIFHLLIIEELGYRAHYLNTFLRPYRGVMEIERIHGPIMTSTMDAFVDIHQLDVITLMKDMVDRSKELLPGERRLIDHIEESYPMKELLAELEFLISRKRIIGLLSGVADIRINTGKQSIPEFLRWANIITGMEKSAVMEAVTGPALSPGHHAHQQIISIELKELSGSMRSHGVSLKDFNTLSTRMGFPVWKRLKGKIMEI